MSSKNMTVLKFSAEFQSNVEFIEAFRQSVNLGVLSLQGINIPKRTVNCYRSKHIGMF